MFPHLDWSPDLIIVLLSVDLQERTLRSGKGDRSVSAAVRAPSSLNNRGLEAPGPLLELLPDTM